MKNKYAYAACVAATLSFLTACGDDVTEVTNVNESTGIEQVAKYKKLPKCEEENEGSLVFVKDSAKVYVCVDKSWMQLNGADGKDGKDGKDGEAGKDGKNGKDGANGSDGKSCSAKQSKDKKGFDIICDGETVGTIKNGSDGDDGKDGASCEAKQNKDKSGFDIICDGETVGTIKDGEDGSDGKDGTSCALKDKGGQIVITCGSQVATITKALCGTDPYDPAVSFCSEHDTKVYPLCHNANTGYEENLNEDGTYDTRSYFCDVTDILTARCLGGLAYDMTTQFCGRYGVSDRCDEVAEGLPEDALKEDGSYSNRQYFCDAKGVLHELCGGSTYDPELQFCTEDAQVVAYCGTGANKQTYDLATHMCVDGNVEEAWECCIPEGQSKNWCNGHESSKYDVRTHFCDNRDGRPYKFTIIAPEGTGYSEVWMAENLQFKPADASESKCPSDDEEKCSTNGLLYTWAAAKSYCPDGWHLPTGLEYGNLEYVFGGESAAALNMRVQDATNGRDLYGFSSLASTGWYNPNASGWQFTTSGDMYWLNDTDLYYASISSVTGELEVTKYDQKVNAVLISRLWSDADYYPLGDGSYASVRCVKD